jgi:hypothetical protein
MVGSALLARVSNHEGSDALLLVLRDAAKRPLLQMRALLMSGNPWEF